MIQQIKIIRILWILAVIFIESPLQLLAQQTCNYLVWSDEFNNAGAPDEDKWGYDIGGHGWGNQELQNYTNTRTNSFINDGKLTIKAIRQNGTWTSARLVTRGKGDWLYGRIEVKAKLPAGKGTWPAIWMLPTDWVYGDWPKSGEIDIMEHVGYDMGKIHGTIHTEAYNHSIGTQIGGSTVMNDVASAFHVYAIDWTEDKIVWYVDGEEYFRIDNPKRTYKEWPFDKRFHLILNIAIGGTWGGAQGIDPNLEEAVMEIDYVRVYKKQIPAPEINGKKNAVPGGEYVFSTRQIQGVNYKWSFPAGVQIVRGENSPSVTVNWGNNGGTVNLQLFSDCDTVSAPPFNVSTVVIPSGSSFEIPLFDDQNNPLWQAVPGSSNILELSGTNSLIAGYTINATGENPHILYVFQSPVDLRTFNKIEIVLKTPGPVPGSFRVDLEDVNGNVNLKDLFKVNSFEDDGEYHTYSYEFGQNPDGIYDLSLIKSIKIYINYGLFGKKGTGNIEIQRITLFNISTSIRQINDIHEIKIWPDPYSNHLNVSTTKEVSKIEGYNLQGQLLFIQNINDGSRFNTISVNSSSHIVLLKITFADNSAAISKTVNQR